MPFTHVDNICAAIAWSIAQPATYGKTFVVGDVHSYSLRFLIEHLRQEMHVRGMTMPISTGVFRTAIRSANGLCAAFGRGPLLDLGKLLTLTTSVEYDISAFIEATGYTPPVSVETGLADIAAWYQERGSL